MPTAEDVKNRIEAAIPESTAEVESPDNVHFNARVVSPAFTGRSRTLGALTLGIVNKFLEPVAGAVLGKIVVLVLLILFIQQRPRGMFPLKGRAVET